jgi:hypothetical protein
MNILESINIYLFYRYSIYYKILYSFYITKLSCISKIAKQNFTDIVFIIKSYVLFIVYLSINIENCKTNQICSKVFLHY